MSALIAFRNRKLSDLFNRKLVRIAREGSKYDVDLVSTNGQVVQAHRLILSMYSKYLRRLLSNSSPDLKIIGKQEIKMIKISIPINCDPFYYVFFY